MCLITANIYSNSKIFHQYWPLTFHFKPGNGQLPLLTQWDYSARTGEDGKARKKGKASKK